MGLKIIISWKAKLCKLSEQPLSKMGLWSNFWIDLLLFSILIKTVNLVFFRQRHCDFFKRIFKGKKIRKAFYTNRFLRLILSLKNLKFKYIKNLFSF